MIFFYDKDSLKKFLPFNILNWSKKSFLAFDSCVYDQIYHQIGKAYQI